MTTLQKAQEALQDEFGKANELTAKADELRSQATAIVTAALRAAAQAADALENGDKEDDDDDTDGGADELREEAADLANDFAWSNGLEFDGDIEDPGFWEPSTC